MGVVTWNTAELTVRALRSLLDTEEGCDLRLLVRDNASTDGTAEAVAAAVPEAELDAGHENLGFAAGVNSLLARSDAPFFLMLNSDAWPERGAVAALVDAARDRPRAAAVAPRLERPDGALEHSTHPFPSVRVAVTAALAPRRVMWDHRSARSVDWAVGAALLLRREAVTDVGGFDETLFMYAEDLDWCWRARRRGWEIWFEPTAVVRHVGNASGAQAYGGLRTATHLRNAYRVYRREHGGVGALAYRAANLAGASSRLLGAYVGRRNGSKEWWKEQVRGHLGRPR